eukprot:comp21922_c0_seq1/m.49882 comp21922_c0_seq1/g.49882  ORF comp21922_c0_seq1/g.49882 comp21922_c0_seq1/m.49882 type:complete len:550 (-) comp21922_c0_seq1:74-1723(-)
MAGGTQSTGVMSETGWHSGDSGKYGLGILAIWDPQGEYVVTQAKINKADPRKSGADAVALAGSAAYQKKKLKGIWLMTEPGLEEKLMEGIIDAVGSAVPIGGGSSGNNDGSEKGYQFINGAAVQGALVTVLMYSWLDIHASFENGFNPTNHHGVVTKATERIVTEIDARPAADVYNEWTGNVIGPEAKARAGTVLGKVTLHPLGRVSMIDPETGDPLYVTIVPVAITKDGGFSTLNELYPGDTIYLMAGNRQNIIKKLSATYRRMLRTPPVSAENFCGGIMSFCVCYVLTIQDEFPNISRELASIFKKPFIGISTFGEQGSFRKGINGHGNLMIASLFFTKPSNNVQKPVSLDDVKSIVAPTGHVSIVFAAAPQLSDVQNWNKDIGKECTQSLLRTWRELLIQFNGYEVKSGDGDIMASFSTAHAALQWALASSDPNSYSWPAALRGFKGSDGTLAVRIGVHAGRPEFEYNPAAKKVDYMGPVVNLASRVSTYSGPDAPETKSAVLVSSNVINEIKLSRDRLGVQIASLGSKKLKGIQDKVDIHMVTKK